MLKMKWLIFEWQQETNEINQQYTNQQHNKYVFRTGII